MEGIRETNFGSCGRSLLSIALAGFILLGTTGQAFAQAIPQKNVNAIGPAPLQWLYSGNPRMQQNESEGVESVVFPGHLAIGFNDYRGVNDPAIAEAFPGIAMSTDGGETWISGLHPLHFGDIPSLGQPGGADPNLEIAPYMMFYNFIAFSRDGSTVPGVYMSRWYEPNREVGAPFRHLDTLTINTGTTSKFLDKPSFKAALRNPADDQPDIAVQIPAFQDPLNSANFHAAYTLNIPALRLHLCYSVFVGNDNNSGTKIECLASDNGGVTFDIKNKLSESVEINQGTYIETRNFGRDVVVVWTRFQDNNETAAIMYAMSTDYGSTYSKAKVVTEFCPFNQSTGAARFRTNALPVIVSNDFDFSVYIASRNDATETCLIPGKGSAPDKPRMSPVSLADDFDSFGEEVVNGVRTKDGMVRTSLNFSRIMMIRGSGNGNLSWDTPVAVDPQEQVNENGLMARKRSHQFMPACAAAGGIETCSWYDSRLDKFNGIMQNLPAAPFVEDMVLHLEPGMPVGDPNSKVTPTLLPAGAYENVPDPALLPPNKNNLPLRRTIDVFAAQIQGGSVRPYTVNRDSFYATDALDPNKISSPSVRVTRFPTRQSQKPGAAPGEREQVEWNYANARLFRKGKSSFIGDYNTLFAQTLRQNRFLEWVSNQSAPDPVNDLFASREPVFRAGWTSNRNVRGKVFYTGCDEWDPVEQIWKAGAGCDSTYTEPGTLLPLQGEDGSNDGPPLTCLAAYTAGKARAPLTRNQNIYTAALVPGISTRVVSAIKPADGGRSTFVLQMLNGSKADRRVNLALPQDSFVSFGADQAGSLLSIPVHVPGGSGNVRTVFDFGNADTDDLAPSVIVTVTDAVTNDVLARVPLVRASFETPPLGNVLSNPDLGEAPVDLLGGGEFYDLILKREIGVESTFDLENFDLENTAELFDLENLDLTNFDLENQLVFFDLENFDLENTDLQNDLYQAFDLENLVLNLSNPNDDPESLLYFDLENFELENFDLENFDLENFELENFELENFDLENFDLENFELENETVFASSIDNFELENFELENAVVPGDDFAEVSWTADSSGNTTTGVDVRPIFSPSLAQDLVDAGTTVVLTVRRGYLNGTVGYASSLTNCSAEIVVQNQVLYAAVLTADQIWESAFYGTVGDPDPLLAETPGFFLTPDGSTVVSLRFINPPANVSFDDLEAGSGAALFTQPGNSVTCDAELPGMELDAACEVDFTLPDVIPPVITAPADITTEATGVQTSVAIGTATATDAVTATPDIVITSDAPATFPIGTTTVTWTATDAEGNSATATQNVTVNDTTAPTLSGVPADMSKVEASSPAGATVTWTDPTASDSAGTATASCLPVSGSTFAIGSTLVTCTATDSATPANTATGSFSITVSDTTAPTLSGVPADMSNVEATSSAGATVTWTDPTALDSAGTATVSCLPASGSTFAFGSTPVTCTATDSATPANTATASFNVTVGDSTAPLIILLGDDPVMLEAGELYVEAGVTVADAGDPSVTVVIGGDVVDTSLVGTYVITYNATDASTNAALLVTRSVIVSDNSVPVIGGISPPIFTPTEPFVLAPGDTTFVIEWPVSATDPNPNLKVYCDVGSVPDRIYPTVSTSGSSIVYTFSYPFVVGTTSVSCTAEDQGGNTDSGTFTVTVEDYPVIDLSTLPTQPFTVEANDPSGYVGPTASLWGPITATDQIDGTVTAVCLPTNNLALGVNVISCTATDSAGNVSTTETFDATIVDTTAPEITSAMLDIKLEANAPSGYVWQGAPAAPIWSAVQAFDIVDEVVEATCAPSSVSNFALNSGELSTTHTVTCIARDAAGNPQDAFGNPLSLGDPGFPASAKTSFKVTIEDNRPPIINQSLLPDPAPSTNPLEANGGNGYTPSSPLWADPIAGAATDIVDGLVNVTCMPGPTSVFSLGDTDVSCSSTDARGNPSMLAPAFTISVGDSTPPDVTIDVIDANPAEATGPSGASVAFSATAFDIVSGSIPASCSVDSNPVTSPHVFALGDSVLTCVATDGQGVQGSAMTTVSVVDTTPPVISATPKTVYTTSASATVFRADLEANITASDLVDGDAVTVACLIVDPTVYPVNEPTADPNYYAIQCTAADSEGKVASTMLQLTVAFQYDFTIIVPKGKIQAGSTLPVDFYYEDNGTRVDASAFAPSASWVGPYENPGCVTEGADFGLGSGDDSGSSSFRWSASQQITQFSWQTPPIPGNYKFTISPPGTSDSTVCISLK